MNLYAKDPLEAKYQLFINKCKRVGVKYCNDPTKTLLNIEMIGMIFMKILISTI